MGKHLKSWPKHERRLNLDLFGQIYEDYRDIFDLRPSYPLFKTLPKESLNKLDSALGAIAYESHQGFRFKPGTEATCAYLYFINKSHFLEDGNKRASIAAALGYLSLHDKYLSCHWQTIYNIALEIAISKSRKSIWKKIIRFVDGHLVDLEESMIEGLTESVVVWQETAIDSSNSNCEVK